jgi:probable H4MPT-linked C1 transfer pathway protein
VQTEPVVGWDLGGAHLKAVRMNALNAVDQVLQLPCPLWEGMDRLHGALDAALSVLHPAALHAVTMTGEMVDLFADRAEGVKQIVATMRERLPAAGLRFYAGGTEFLDSNEAVAAPMRLASANWMASASLVAAKVSDALFVDIGSTTTDLIVVKDGRLAACGRDDFGRLVAGELVYTGTARTPLMAVAEMVPFEGHWVPVIAEYFATTADVYRLLGLLPESADQHPAADGGEKTLAGSARRLARMVGRDMESAPLLAWQQLARWLARAQSRRIEDACERLLSREAVAPKAPLVVAGAGRFLATDIASNLRRTCREFATLVTGPAAEAGRVSDCAPAVAVAWLAQQESRRKD